MSFRSLSDVGIVAEIVSAIVHDVSSAFFERTTILLVIFQKRHSFVYLANLRSSSTYHNKRTNTN